MRGGGQVRAGQGRGDNPHERHVDGATRGVHVEREAKSLPPFPPEEKQRAPPLSGY